MFDYMFMLLTPKSVAAIRKGFS